MEYDFVKTGNQNKPISMQFEFDPSEDGFGCNIYFRCNTVCPKGDDKSNFFMRQAWFYFKSILSVNMGVFVLYKFKKKLLNKK